MSDQLYGDQTPLAKAKAPSLLEQIEGVFTAPRALFDRLSQTPSWVPAFFVMIGSVVVVTAIWGSRLDMEGFLRPIMERNPNATADQIDKGIEFMSKFGPWIFTIQALFVVTAVIFFTALLYWLIGMGTAESEKPGYTKSLIATVVPLLVMLPHSLLTILLIFIKGVGTLTPEKIPPTSVGYFVHIESPKLSALLYNMDVFAIASWVLIYLAARHTMRLKPLGAGLCTAASIALVLIFRVAFAK
jgi:hypothetical protein